MTAPDPGQHLSTRGSFSPPSLSPIGFAVPPASCTVDSSNNLSVIDTCDAQAILSVGFESQPVIPSVLGVNSGFQRCRVLIHEKRLYKTLVFTDDVFVWEVLHFLEGTVLRNAIGGLSTAQMQSRLSVENYGLYVKSLKKVLDMYKHTEHTAHGSSERSASAPSGVPKKIEHQEAKPWRKLASYALKEKV